jgi:hypothetical protein
VSTTKTTTAGSKSASDAQQKILTALRELGKASAQQISEHAKLAYSTTTAKLRSLEAAGLARRERHPDGATIWQPADPDTGPTAEQPAPEVTTTSTDTPSTGTGTGTGKPSSKRNRPSGSKLKDETDSGGRTAASGTGPDRTRSDADDAGDGAGDGQRARRPKGALRAEVLAVLQDHPDTAFKVSQVCKHLPGASAGAIANALDKLVADGTAKQVADKPATYQAE